MEAGRRVFARRRLTVTSLGLRGPLGMTLPSCTRCLAAATAGTSVSRWLATSNDHDADQRSDLLDPGQLNDGGTNHLVNVARGVFMRPALLVALALVACTSPIGPPPNPTSSPA